MGSRGMGVCVCACVCVCVCVCVCGGGGGGGGGGGDFIDTCTSTCDEILDDIRAGSKFAPSQ